jgi:hypothetical protein
MSDNTEVATPATESQEDPDVAIQRFLAAHGKDGVTWNDFHDIMDKTLTPLFKNYETQIKTLKAEIERLKSRPQLKWGGTFNPGTYYPEASIITHLGSLWAAQTATTAMPGKSNAWVLIVKQPKFRRDELEDALASVMKRAQA